MLLAEPWRSAVITCQLQHWWKGWLPNAMRHDADARCTAGARSLMTSASAVVNASQLCCRLCRWSFAARDTSDGQAKVSNLAGGPNYFINIAWEQVMPLKAFGDDWGFRRRAIRIR